MTYAEQWLNVGTLIAAQGLKGAVRVKPSSDFPERFTKPGKRWIQSGAEEPKEIELLNGRELPGKTLFVIHFAGVNNRDAAQELIGSKLLVPACDRPNLLKGEFHLLDLIGLEARLEPKGMAIGSVKNLYTAGNDLLEIQLKEGQKVLVPFVYEIVPEVNLHEGWLQITPPPGLLEL